jgi:tetratricopeptide (TPR) repeat protein
MAQGFINKQTTEGIETRSLIAELIEKNEIQRAKKLCDNELEKNQADIQVLFFLSKIAAKQSDVDTAIEILLKALNNEPTHLGLQFELAKLLYSSRSSYPDAAKAALNLLNQINSGEYYEKAKILLAEIFTASGYYEEAVNQLKMVLGKNPDNMEAYLQWAKVLIKEAKNTEAFNKIEYVLSKDILLPEAFYLMSQIVSFPDTDGQYLKEMKDILRIKKLSRKEKGFLNFALAKAFKDQNDDKRAYEAYVEAANQINKGLNYDINLDVKLIDNIKKTFNQNVFQNQQESINRSELSNFKPIFVISFPGLGVQELVKDLLKDNATTYLGENSFLSQMLTGSRYSNNFLNLITKFTELDSENLDIFRLHYLGNVAKVVGDSVSSIDTSKMNFIYVGLIKLLFPHAEIIYLRSTVKENAMLETYLQLFDEPEMNFSYNLKNLNQFYIEFEKLMEHWLALFPDIQIRDSVEGSVTKDLLPFFTQDLNNVLKMH